MKLAEMKSIYGKWTVLRYDGNSRYLCRCDCGNEASIRGGHLRSGESNSCKNCQSKSDVRLHLVSIPEKVFMRIYHAAKHAIRRCTNHDHPNYRLYGGRGIKVLFQDKDVFIKYLVTLPGYDNPSLVLDRINNNGHYEPGNLRFATRSESQRNKNPFTWSRQ
jgi:hypothetical protein